jgi:hypothetical protein
MAAQWYYQTSGDWQSGPVDSTQLRRLAEAGIVRPDTLVRQGDGDRWVRAEQVRGLFQPSKPASSSSPGATPPPVPQSGALEASEKPERVWPVTWVAIIVGSGTVLLLALVFRGGSAPQQQAEKDQPSLAVAQSAESEDSAPAPQAVLEDLAAAIELGHISVETALGNGASSGFAVDAYLINQRNIEVSVNISLTRPLFMRNRGRGQNMIATQVFLHGGDYVSDGFRSFVPLQPKLRTRV